MATKDEQSMIDTYRTVATSKSILAIASTFVPRPSEADFAFGELNRFFAQQANQKFGEIFEVSPSAFSALQQKSLYTTIQLKWKVSGPAENTVETDPDTGETVVDPLSGKPIVTSLGVRQANKAAINEAAKTMPAIKQKLTNVFQLWQGF
jgi:hypothetical protein